MERIFEQMREIKNVVPKLAERIIYEKDFERILIMYSNRIPVTQDDIDKIETLDFVHRVRQSTSSLDYIIET